MVKPKGWVGGGVHNERYVAPQRQSRSPFTQNQSASASKQETKTIHSASASKQETTTIQPASRQETTTTQPPSTNEIRLLQHIKSLYNDKSCSDFTVVGQDGKIYLQKNIIGSIDFFKTFFSTQLGNGNSKSEITVESVKTVDPIFKYIYGYSQSEIADQVDNFSGPELIDFFKQVLYFMIEDLYSFVITLATIYVCKILDDDINNCHILYIIFDSVSDPNDKNIISENLSRLQSRIRTYITGNISFLSKDFINTVIFKDLSEEAQMKLIFGTECYELMNDYVYKIDSDFFTKFRTVFEKMCSPQQLSYLAQTSWINHDDHSYFKIISVYPEFEIQIRKFVGKITGTEERYKSVIMCLSSSTLSTGDTVEINGAAKHTIGKIIYNGEEVTKMYPRLEYRVFIGEMYEPVTLVRKIKILTHKFTK